MNTPSFILPDCLAPLAGRDGLLPHLRQFDDYAGGYIRQWPEQAGHHALKREHTWRVLAYALRLLDGAELSSPAVGRVALLAALYHDIGRFEQFRQYGTYADAASANHAMLSLVALHKIRALQGELPVTASQIKTAVALHNRFVLPSFVTGDRLAVTHLVRDADKLDIMRILAGSLGPGCTPDPVVVMFLRNEPGKCTPSFMQGLQTGDGLNYNNMRYVNDFRMLLCQWMEKMHYPLAKKILLQEGHLRQIVQGIDLPQAAQLAEEYLKRHE